MARQLTEAERLRECRQLFERAQAAGCTPAELRRHDAERRWTAVSARLAAKREDEGQALAWWQR